jgi:hypothetical protein
MHDATCLQERLQAHGKCSLWASSCTRFPSVGPTGERERERERKKGIGGSNLRAPSPTGLLRQPGLQKFGASLPAVQGRDVQVLFSTLCDEMQLHRN